MKLSNIFKQTLNESGWSDEHDRLTKQEIEDWCKKAKIRDAQIVKEGKEFVINVLDRMQILTSDLPTKDGNLYFPYQFGEINGDFKIVSNSSGTFKSLKNGPISVYGTYSAPNLGIESLDGMAGVVLDSCNLSNNKLSSWEGIPSQCGKLIIAKNKIESFTGISKHWVMGSELVCDPIERGVLELLEIEGLETVAFMHHLHGKPEASDISKAQNIINTHLQGDRDVIDMQSDFIDAGLEEWTKK